MRWHALVGQAQQPLPIEDQLRTLDHLVARHHTFWVREQRANPSRAMLDFLQHHWGPWTANWWAIRPLLDSERGRALFNELRGAASNEDPTETLVRAGASSLSSIRTHATTRGIRVPDLQATSDAEPMRQARAVATRDARGVRRTA